MYIQHRPPAFIKALFCLISKNMWQTKIDQSGIRITRLFATSILIPWSEVEYLDVTGLKTNHLSPNRAFFLVILKDYRLVKEACTYTSSYKTWYASKNVLGFTYIDSHMRSRVCDELLSMADLHKVKKDLICL